MADNPHMELVDVFDKKLLAEDMPNARYCAQIAAEVVKANPDVVLRALANDDNGPSLLYERPLYENGPSGGPIVQTWEWIKS